MIIDVSASLSGFNSLNKLTDVGGSPYGPMGVGSDSLYMKSNYLLKKHAKNPQYVSVYHSAPRSSP